MDIFDNTFVNNQHVNIKQPPKCDELAFMSGCGPINGADHFAMGALREKKLSAMNHIIGSTIVKDQQPISASAQILSFD